MGPLPIYFCQNVKDKGLHIKIQGLVVQEKLGQQTQVLTIYLGIRDRNMLSKQYNTSARSGDQKPLCSSLNSDRLHRGVRQAVGVSASREQNSEQKGVFLSVRWTGRRPKVKSIHTNSNRRAGLFTASFIICLCLKQGLTM